jgi:hypothetical protein
MPVISIMRFSALILVIIIFSGFKSMGQSQAFDKLIFNAPPAEWSKQETLDKVTYSNYNVKGAEPATLTIFKSMAMTGKADQQLPQYWRQYLQLSDTATAPRPKKHYTNDGDPMVVASGEAAGPEGKGYYVLAVYHTETWAQPLLIFTPSAKAYRLQLAEWMDRLQTVRLAKAGKR